MKEIAEGKAVIKTTKPKVVSKAMPTFYNPVMELNRSLSVLLIKSINGKNLRIALPLAASGIRGIRFIKELPKSKINEIHFNDYGSSFKKALKSNLKLNKIRLSSRMKIHNKDAGLFLLESSGFDYIDIDPFGSPVKFLDAAIKCLAREGILAVTATDTGALCGTYPNACKRKYWAVPLRNEIMHEFGLRILIRRIQLIGAQYDKAMVPVFSYSKDHYMRVFLRCTKAKKEVDKVLAQHELYKGCGPIWTGRLWDSATVIQISKSCKDEKISKFLSLIKQESRINIVGFFDIHKLCKKLKITVPKKSGIIKNIRKLGYKAAETHFSLNSIKSDISEKEIIKILRNH